MKCDRCKQELNKQEELEHVSINVAKNMKNQGYDNIKIADAIGVHRNTVGKWLHKQ